MQKCNSTLRTIVIIHILGWTGAKRSRSLVFEERGRGREWGGRGREVRQRVREAETEKKWEIYLFLTCSLYSTILKKKVVKLSLGLLVYYFHDILCLLSWMRRLKTTKDIYCVTVFNTLLKCRCVLSRSMTFHFFSFCRVWE